MPRTVTALVEPNKQASYFKLLTLCYDFYDYSASILAMSLLHCKDRLRLFIDVRQFNANNSRYRVVSPFVKSSMHDCYFKPMLYASCFGEGEWRDLLRLASVCCTRIKHV